MKGARWGSGTLACDGADERIRITKITKASFRRMSTMTFEHYGIVNLPLYHTFKSKMPSTTRRPTLS